MVRHVLAIGMLVLVSAGEARASTCEDAAAKANWKVCAAPECPAEIREECERELGAVASPAKENPAPEPSPEKPKIAPTPEKERSPARYIGPIGLGVVGVAGMTWGIGSFVAWVIKKKNLSSGTSFGSSEYTEHDEKNRRLGPYWAAATIGGIVVTTISLAWFFYVNKPKTTAIAPTPDGLLLRF